MFSRHCRKQWFGKWVVTDVNMGTIFQLCNTFSIILKRVQWISTSDKFSVSIFGIFDKSSIIWTSVVNNHDESTRFRWNLTAVAFSIHNTYGQMNVRKKNVNWIQRRRRQKVPFDYFLSFLVIRTDFTVCVPHLT